MKSGVKIVKRGTQAPKNRDADGDQRTDRDTTRQVVNTVRSWISEMQQRRLAPLESFVIKSNTP
jgi:hypothetical protein